MNTEIINIINAGLKKDIHKVKTYAQLLAENSKKSNESLSKRITKEIENSPTISDATFDLLQNKPVDKDSRLDMVETIFPDSTKSELVLPHMLKEKINEFIRALEKRPILESLNIDIPYTLLLYGPPGCGKTSTASYISEKTGLPLVVVKLDAMISSLLGNTAKNINKVFNFIENKDCILFLDEFDAIAKARDDKYESGELKRVVNSLLQGIDSLSNGSIVIAATNHHKLLDPAVWRRFSTAIEIPLPSSDEISILLDRYEKKFPTDFNESKTKKDNLVTMFNKLSYSEIKSIYFSSIRKAVINDDSHLKYIDILLTYAFRNNHVSYKNKDLVNFLYKNYVTKKDIQDVLSISKRKVDSITQGVPK